VVVVGALPHLIHAIHLARLVVNTAHLAIHFAVAMVAMVATLAV